MADNNGYLTSGGLIGLGQQFYNAATKEWMPEIISEAAGLPGEALTATNRLLGIKSPLEQGKYLDYWRKFYGSPYGQEAASPTQGGGISPQAGLGEPFHTRIPYIPPPTSDVGLRSGADIPSNTPIKASTKKSRTPDQERQNILKWAAKYSIPAAQVQETMKLHGVWQPADFYLQAQETRLAEEEIRKAEQFKQGQSEKAREADMRLLSALYKQRMEAVQSGILSEPDATRYMKEAQTYQDKYNELLGIKPLPSPQGGRLDTATAQQLLKEAGGDKNKARQLARERGYSF